MSSILKVDQIQLSNGNTPTVGDLGLNDTGTVLRVVQGTILTSNYFNNSSSFTATPLEVSITPSATTSKLMVQFLPVCRVYNTSGNDAQGTWRIYRKIGSGSYERLGSHEVTQRAYDYGGSGHISDVPIFFQYLDSPSTTSAVSYKIYGSKAAGSAIEMNPDSQDESFAFVTEIAG